MWDFVNIVLLNFLVANTELDIRDPWMHAYTEVPKKVAYPDSAQKVSI